MKLAIPPPHLSLTQKTLAFLLVASILPLVVMGVVSLRVASDTLSDQASHYVAEVSSNRRDYLDLELQNVESLIANISSVDEIVNALDDGGSRTDGYTNLETQARTGYILSGYANLKGLASIDVFTVRGSHYHVGDTLNAGNIRTDLRDRLFGRALSAGRTVVWTGVEDNVNVNSAFPEVLTAVRLLAKTERGSVDSRPVAFLVVSYDLDHLYDYYSQTNLGKDARLMILDAENRVVYHPDRSYIGARANPSFTNNLSEDHGSFATDVDGVNSFIAYSRSARGQFAVVAMIPMTTLLAQTGTIRKTTIALLVGALVMVGLAAVTLTRTVVLPIRAITTRFRLTQGDLPNLDDPLPEFHSGDEISDLVKWFNTFLAGLRTKRQMEQALIQRSNELSLANAGLARAARLKDEFLANMSHELRTPLTGILGLSETLRMEVFGPLSAPQTQAVENIEESGRHLLDLINDILDLSKVEAGKLELQTNSVVIEDVCQASLRFVKQLAQKKGITISYENQLSPQALVLADERRLKQVLVNLLTNAVKFTPAGKEIGLRVFPDTSGRSLHLSVWDTGIDIAAEDQAKLFKPFVQLDAGLARGYSGTGLGLSLVRRMTELHGGGVALSSAVGEGSTFTVTLPWQSDRLVPVAATDDPSAAARREVTASPDSTGVVARRLPIILLAEDNEIIVGVVQSFLESRSYDVAVARDGREAVDQARALQPDLILMDMHMPVMDGLEATQLVKTDSATAATPIIALTALTMLGDRERCLAAGASDYLSKPVSLETLAATISAHLSRRIRTANGGSR